jgi:uncharacterized protein
VVGKECADAQTSHTLSSARQSPMLGAMRIFRPRVRLSWALPLFIAGTVPLAAQPTTVPPPLEQVQVDCTRPQDASDTLVCGDAELRAADAICEDQASWLRRRSLCAFEADHRRCLIAAYTDRHAVLVASMQAATQPMRCNGAWKGHKLMFSAPASGHTLTITENGQLVAVATPPGSGWQPWVACSTARNSIRLQPRGSDPLTCHRQNDHGG